jgi:hypothetical protein
VSFSFPLFLDLHFLAIIPAMKRIEQVIAGICGLILLIVVVQSLVPTKYVLAPPAPAAQLAACMGAAIPVEFPYLGTVNDPWTCKPQCDDDQPRYILYSNGKATQCETPPGCNDTGEDTGVTCNPPALKSTQ